MGVASFGLWVAITAAAAVAPANIRIEQRNGAAIEARTAEPRGEVLVVVGLDGTHYSLRARDVLRVSVAGPRPAPEAAHVLPAIPTPTPFAAAVLRRVPGGTLSVVGRDPSLPTERGPAAPRGARPSEAVWRNLAAKVLRQVARAQADLEAAVASEGGSNRPPGLAVSRPKPRKRGASGAGPHGREQSSRVEKAEQKVRAAEADLADLCERGRRAGVPPGWLR